MVAKNNRVPNDHLRKYWFHRVKTYFDDAAQAKARRAARAAVAQKKAPAPVEGPLRPVVSCPTVRYNTRMRLGRGFTRDELVAAGFNPAQARFLGIAVDARRSHTKDAAVRQMNIDRLVAYKNAMVIYKKDDEKKASASKPELFALPAQTNEVKFRTITADERKIRLFKTKQAAFKAYRASLKEKEAEKRKK